MERLAAMSCSSRRRTEAALGTSSPVACQVDRCNALASIRVNSAEHLRRNLGVYVLKAPVDLAACAARVGLLDEIHVRYPVSEVRRPAECDSDGAVRLLRNEAVRRQRRILHLESKRGAGGRAAETGTTPAPPLHSHVPL